MVFIGVRRFSLARTFAVVGISQGYIAPTLETSLFPRYLYYTSIPLIPANTNHLGVANLQQDHSIPNSLLYCGGQSIQWSWTR
jgi:hypothetical protein